VKLMNVRVRSAAVAAVLVGAAAAGCSGGGGGGVNLGGGATMPVVSGLESTSITVYDYPAIDSAGLYVAQDEGLFQKEGLSVTIVPDFKSSQDTVDAIETGKAQVSGGDYVTYMNDLVGQGSNLEIVAEASVLRPNVLALMAAPHSKIISLEQLRGKSVPVSGIHDIANLLIDSVLLDNNIPTNSVNYVPNVPLPGVPAMIAKGVFAAGPVPEPYVSTGEQQQGDVVLADLDQGATSDFPILGFSVTRQWAQQHPNTLKAFVTALEAGQEIADTNRAAVEHALEGQPLKIPASIAAVISLPNFPIGVESGRLQRVVSDMIQFGFFKGKQLAAAQKFQVKNVIYPDDLDNVSGQTGLLKG
jgi:NitT/TauT family transport system substrate-binding protein